MAQNKQVVIIGAGFGGLFAAKALANKPVDVLVIDKHNYHTFTPLLYQVATCALDPSEIAHPVRTIFRKKRNVKSLLGELTAIDVERKEVTIQADHAAENIPYDYLILAAGSESNYFGNQEIEAFSFDLKSLADAVELRNHALRLFERAVWATDPAERAALLTFVVVGGGPTGIETAGALYELYNHVLDQEYRTEKLKARVVLVEMMDSVLNAYPEKLRQSAEKQLKSLGVEVRLGAPVARIEENDVVLRNGTVIQTHTLVWSAGVKGSSVSQLLDVELAPGNRLGVERTLQIKGIPAVYCIGDMCYLENETGAPYPQVVPVAQQQAEIAAKNILAEITGTKFTEFKYHDRGSMATIGRSRAVAWLYNRFRLSGFPAWIAWLFLHLVTLIGFRNRLNVLVNWVMNYLTYDRSVRIILDRRRARE